MRTADVYSSGEKPREPREPGEPGAPSAPGGQREPAPQSAPQPGQLDFDFTAPRAGPGGAGCDEPREAGSGHGAGRGDEQTAMPGALPGVTPGVPADAPLGASPAGAALAPEYSDPSDRLPELPDLSEFQAVGPIPAAGPATPGVPPPYGLFDYFSAVASERASPAGPGAPPLGAPLSAPTPHIGSRPGSPGDAWGAVDAPRGGQPVYTFPGRSSDFLGSITQEQGYSPGPAAGDEDPQHRRHRGEGLATPQAPGPSFDFSDFGATYPRGQPQVGPSRGPVRHTRAQERAQERVRKGSKGRKGHPMPRVARIDDDFLYRLTHNGMDRGAPSQVLAQTLGPEGERSSRSQSPVLERDSDLETAASPAVGSPEEPEQPAHRRRPVGRSPARSHHRSRAASRAGRANRLPDLDDDDDADRPLPTAFGFIAGTGIGTERVSNWGEYYPALPEDATEIRVPPEVIAIGLTPGTRRARARQARGASDSSDDSEYRLQPRKRRLSEPWSSEEDAALREGYAIFEGRDWSRIAKFVSSRCPGRPPRTSDQCSQRFWRCLSPGKKGAWTAEEDRALIEAVRRCPPKSWKQIAALVPGRCDIQCRYRLKRLREFLLKSGDLAANYLP